MATAAESQLPPEPHIPPPPPMSSSKQNRILIWRREVASALLDDAASNASSHSSSSTVTNATATTTASSGPHHGAAAALSPTLALNADSPTSSFSSTSLPSSRPRALWKRLSRRLAIHHAPEIAVPVESPRTAMYRDNPLDASLALEGLTVVGSGGGDRVDAPAAAAVVQAAIANREPKDEQQPLGAESSSGGVDRGLRERQERLQRAARLLEHGPKKEEMAPVVSVVN
ncbi:hypothetical protein HJFPF1_01500 [Paramyrothecium foliicola]|nr:hypothetical protein HJFPF1_01500 [Paramyrothecium foliicola]